MTATILIGIGLMAAVDEIVFHQVLSWHHFYDRATPPIALLSDGLLHSAELMLLIAGFFCCQICDPSMPLRQRPVGQGFL